MVEDPPATTVRPARQWLRRDDGALASLCRFALVGGAANLVYVLVFSSLAGSEAQLANAVGVVVSTALANELHRRITFHARRPIRWYRAQWQGGGLALAGLVCTTSALAGLAELVGQPSTGLQAGLLVGVTGLVGLVRFLALRVWFGSGPRPEVDEPTP